ncbi:MAG TPA: GGDEF domain-containing protein, partial [Bacillota bacterium]|nr:GGDEF domain-containing protein [Bacillota bacterium]
LDIDHFKEFNDTYGHDLGDEVLKLVASSGEMMIRETDLFARFGGEEFIVVLVGTNSQNMMVVADAIRTVMQNTGVVHDGKTLQVTVSIGVTMARKDDTIDAVIKRADQMMYESKQQGRNRVSFG